MMDFQAPQRAASPTVFPRFYMDQIEHTFESARAGRPVWLDVEMVEITVAGDTRTQVHQRVKDEHRQRWPKAYEAFKAGLTPAVDGYPIEQWPPLSPAMVANFKAANIHTVEQLASLSDGHLGNLGLGGRQIRDRAAAWLKQAETGGEVDRLLAEMETEREKRIATERELQELKGVVDRLTEKLIGSQNVQP